MVVRFPEPVHAVILHTDVELAFEPLDVIVSKQSTKVPIPVKWRIPDDRVRSRPFHPQRVAHPDPREVGERQRRLRQAELVDRELVAHPQGHARKRDREPLDLDPLHVREREVQAQRTLIAQTLATAQLDLALVQAPLKPAQFAVGDIKEVPGAAGRVEHHVVEEVVLRRDRLLVRGEVLDPVFPRLDDRRLNDLLDVRLVRVVGAEPPLLIVTEAALEQRAEDRRLDVLPLESSCGAQVLELLARQVHTRGLLE